MRSRFVLAGLMAAALLSACTSAPAATAPTSHEPSGPPALDVSVVLDGLDHPWDVAQAPDGTLLVDERSGGLRAVRPDGDVREVRSDFGDLFARGETGLMGLTLDPGFATAAGSTRARAGRRVPGPPSPSSPGRWPRTGRRPPASPTRWSVASR